MAHLCLSISLNGKSGVLINESGLKKRFWFKKMNLVKKNLVKKMNLKKKEYGFKEIRFKKRNSRTLKESKLKCMH